MLDQMPPEVVTRICEHSCRSDLYSFARLSQRCHKLAAAVLYRQISLSLDNLQSEVTRWTKVLDRTKLWSAPRCVVVADSYNIETTETTSSLGSPSADLPSSDESRKEAIPKLCIPLLEKEDPIKSGEEALYEITRSNPKPCQTDSEATPLTGFLPKLSSLGRLMWYSDAAPAPSVAHLLRSELSGCQLQLKAFSVYGSADLEYVRELVTLRNLRSIWFQHTPINRLRGLMQQILRHNSVLEEVRMLYGVAPSGPFREFPLKWNNQDYEDRDGSQLARLASLQLAGAEEDYKDWTRCIDFSCLRHLSLDCGVTGSELEMLLALQLNSLDSLAIALVRFETSSGDDGDSSDQYYEILRTFMGSIRPLSRLRLTGSCETSKLRSILNHHAMALRTLYLVPDEHSTFSFTASTIALVTETCKNVVELGLTMRRHWDKPREDVAVLNAIGRLPELSDLRLVFDALEHYSTPWDGSEDRFSDAFKNSAIDADLAKAVFDRTVSSEMSDDPDIASESCLKKSRLRDMSFAAKGGGDCHDMSSWWVVEEVGRRWIVKRP